MMHYDDHAPPHFHVKYGEFEAMIGINPLGMLRGFLPPRALSLVIEWAAMHQNDLLKDWELAEKFQELKKIPPLE
jgi:hypothetical protein